jgi:hypothetical protein
MRGQDRGPRGQRALDAEGGRRQATADRRIRMLLTTACYGMQGTMSVAGPLSSPTITGGSNRRKGLGRREEKAYQHCTGIVLVLASAVYNLNSNSRQTPIFTLCYCAYNTWVPSRTFRYSFRAWLGWACLTKKVYGPWHQGVYLYLPIIICA